MAGSAGRKAPAISRAVARRSARGCLWKTATMNTVSISKHRAYQRRHDARDQELNDRDAGDGAVDDQRDRRREDRPERRRSTCDRSGEGRIEAALLHGVDLDAAKPANIGERGPRHAGENEAAEDVYLRQSTGNAADQRVGEAEDAVGDAGQVHQIADEDEQRDRHQREGIEGVGDALGEQP